MIRIVFDGPPGPEAGRFIEVEDGEGKSISFGEWQEGPNGYWYLIVPDHLAALAEKEKMLAAFMGEMDHDQKEAEYLHEQIAALTKGLRNVLYQGYNEDCLLCGFKDKIADEALRGNE